MPVWEVSFGLRLDQDSAEFRRLLIEAHAMARVIRGIPIPPGVQNRIDALNILRAVRGTTGIEGSELNEQQVDAVLRSAKPNVLPARLRREEQEVLNAREVMLYVAQVLDRSPKRPLTEGLICKLHQITTQGIDYPNNTPGRYRSHAVSAGTYVPPRTGAEVAALMKRFVEWFNSGPPSKWDPALRAVVAHFYVVSIHPFGDGNGRTARAVESFLLYQGGLNARGFYSLANYYYRRRGEYVDKLDEVRFRSGGDLTPFVRFALLGLVEELGAVHGEILDEVRRIAYRDYAREHLFDLGKLHTRAGERMLSFVIELSSQRAPVAVADIRRRRHHLAALYTKVTPKTLTRDINYLCKVGLVKKINGAIAAHLALMDRFVPTYVVAQRKVRGQRSTGSGEAGEQ